MRLKPIVEHYLHKPNSFLQVMNGSYESPYTNPGAPVHIVTGSAVSIHIDAVGSLIIILDWW